jgi:hypothetical protein
MLNSITSWVRQESASTQAIIQSFIALGIAFQWWNWSSSQTGALIGIIGVLLSMFVRSQVTPTTRPMGEGRPLIPDPSA